MADATKLDEDGLKVLVDSKILNPNITLSQLLEVTKRLDSGVLNEQSPSKWFFIVKGKFIYRDDSASIIKGNGDWPPKL